jgi:rod shape-determining protein MreD
VLLDWGKSAALVFVAAILQVSVFSTVTILNGTPDLLLVAIICVALLRGPVVGAAIGFWGGLLVDTANLETLGVT